MPLYQMLCIALHVDKYDTLRQLVRQTAMHVMDRGGVVRNIESWGTLQLPQRMKKKRTQSYEHFGDYWTLRFDTNPQTIRSLNNVMRRDPRVLRWSILKMGDRVEEVAKQGLKSAQNTSSISL